MRDWERAKKWRRGGDRGRFCQNPIWRPDRRFTGNLWRPPATQAMLLILTCSFSLFHKIKSKIKFELVGNRSIDPISHRDIVAQNSGTVNQILLKTIALHLRLWKRRRLALLILLLSLLLFSFLGRTILLCLMRFNFLVYLIKRLATEPFNTILEGNLN